jgi:hypothetical protein
MSLLKLQCQTSQLKYIGLVNLVVWLHMLSGPCWCMSVAVRQTYTSKSLITYAVTPPDQPDQCILIDCFDTVNLASSYSALPDDDDDDCTETCWSCFNVNFNTPFKAILLCISW